MSDDRIQDYKKAFIRYTTLQNRHPESRKAIEWLRSNVEKFVPTVQGHEGLGKTASEIMPGKFYLYGYDPKWKKVLPVYDTFPYILVTSVNYSNYSFRGINFHYLPYTTRVNIFASLYEIAANTKIPGGKKDGMIWRRAQAIAEVIGASKFLGESIKMYLFTHVKTTFIQVPKEDWALTAFLPVAQMHYNRKSQ